MGAKIVPLERLVCTNQQLLKENGDSVIGVPVGKPKLVVKHQGDLASWDTIIKKNRPRGANSVVLGKVYYGQKGEFRDYFEAYPVQYYKI